MREFRHRRSGEVVYVCEECEALWPEGRSVTPIGFQDFQSYFAGKALEHDWDAVQETGNEG